MSGLFGNTFGDLFGNLFGDSQLNNGRVWRRERRPIRRYTDWTRWSEVATDQVRLRNALNLAASVATDHDIPEAANLIEFQSNLVWIDIEFARRSDLLDKAEEQVNQAQHVLDTFIDAITPPPPPVEIGDVMAQFRGN